MSTKKHFTEAQAKEIGEKLGITWKEFDVELEHGTVNMKTNVTNDDALITGKIALAHLNEFPDYYTRLKKMEVEGDKFWEKS